MVIWVDLFPANIKSGRFSRILKHCLASYINKGVGADNTKFMYIQYKYIQETSVRNYTFWAKLTHNIQNIGLKMENKNDIVLLSQINNLICYAYIFLDISPKKMLELLSPCQCQPEFIYLFIFGKAVDFWGLVGLLSSSPIPCFHVGFKSIYCFGWRKPKKKKRGGKKLMWKYTYTLMEAANVWCRWDVKYTEG